jgi:hypothetical protein
MRTGSFNWRRLGRDAAVIVGVAWFVVGWFVVRYHIDWFTDAIDYWSVNPAGPYEGTVLGGQRVFSYSPALAQVFVVLGRLPLELFLSVWVALNVAVGAWLVWPRPLIALMLAQPIADEFASGQIEFLMTIAIVVGFRYPATWAFVLLAKVTPGVGLLWFAMRREWRSLAIALGATAGIAMLSFVMAPDWWSDWIDFLGRSPAGQYQQTGVRILAAAALVAWGARTDRRWTVPVAACLAMPVVYMHSLAMLAGVARAMEPAGRTRSPYPEADV